MSEFTFERKDNFSSHPCGILTTQWGSLRVWSTGCDSDSYDGPRKDSDHIGFSAGGADEPPGLTLSRVDYSVRVDITMKGNCLESTSDPLLSRKGSYRFGDATRAAQKLLREKVIPALAEWCGTVEAVRLRAEGQEIGAGIHRERIRSKLAEVEAERLKLFAALNSWRS